MRFGRVRSIFGVVSLDPIVAYANLSRLGGTRGLIVAHVDRRTPPDADVLVFDGLATLMASVSSLHSDMVIVLCAGPLQLASMPGLIPVDYSIVEAASYDLLRPDYMKVIRSAVKGSGCLRVKPINTDYVLASIIEATASDGAILIDMNSLFGMCNALARKLVRDELVKVFTLGNGDLSALLEKLDSIADKSIQDRVDKMKASLATEDFKRLVLAVRTLNRGKSSASSLGSKYKLEAFEISYFHKMCAQVVDNRGARKHG